jgi:hypothetical protein
MGTIARGTPAPAAAPPCSREVASTPALPPARTRRTSHRVRTHSRALPPAENPHTPARPHPETADPHAPNPAHFHPHPSLTRRKHPRRPRTTSRIISARPCLRLLSTAFSTTPTVSNPHPPALLPTGLTNRSATPVFATYIQLHFNGPLPDSHSP